MNNLTTSRRKFLKSATASALGLTLLPGFISRKAPSDRLRIAHIGVNGMGTSHLKWFANIPEVEIVALCDLDEAHLAKAKKTLLEIHPNSKVRLYNDFRKVLEQPDIDAITCATPDHWHAQIAVMAFEAGKDVYGEKPLSFDVVEGQQMLKSQQKHNKIFQLGTQIHAGDNYHRVAEIVQSGILGKISTVRLWKTGQPPIIESLTEQAPPVNLNYDMWLGPAPYSAYAPEKTHFNYRYFMDYSGGIFQDFWCHIADVVWMSMNPTGLQSIDAKGKVSSGVGNTPEWINVDYKFKDLDIHWTSEPPKVKGADKMGIGAYFEGENATLMCDYSNCTIIINGEEMNDVESVPITIPRSLGHQQNFVDAVKSRTQPESNLAYARKMTMPMHLGLISWQLGRKLDWNSEKEKFIGDKEANELLIRKKRKAYNWM
ncbi:MAG: hypothetical protein ACI9V1_001414 [Spirosomataceae bacterium]|jgi:hypothetical protein